MSARSDLADYLRTELGGTWRVEPARVSIDNLDCPAALVDRESTKPSEDAQGLRDETLAVYVITPRLGLPEAEDDLDSVLELALAVLESSRLVTWTEATREQYGEAGYHAYKITCESRTQL